MIPVSQLYLLGIFTGIASLIWFGSRVFATEKINQGKMSQRIEANKIRSERNENSINRLEEHHFRLQSHLLGRYEPPAKIYVGDSDAMEGVNAHINVKIFITEYFSREEMLDLAFHVGIDEENEWRPDALPGEIARKTVNFAYRNKKISLLKHEIKRLRPHFGMK